MREIKFRAWDKKNNAMVVVWGINWLDFTNQKVESVFAVNPVIKGEYLLKHEDAEIMQFTGLRDKHGVEIYEHDYVRFTYSCHDKAMNRLNIERLMLVKWMGAGFHLIDNIGCINLDHVYKFKNRGFGDALFEVIGNRFQHPELLNAK